MEIKVVRKYFSSDSTAGKFYIDGKFFCYTLEDEIRKVKVPGETAIPYGSYPVLLTWSPKFGKIVPLIDRVPNFSGIRIHPGRTEASTDGCLLVGESLSRDKQQLIDSRSAYDRLFAVLDAAKQRGESITILFTYEEVEVGKKLFFVIIVVVVASMVYYILTDKRLSRKYT
jgi:hypothetical protein